MATASIPKTMNGVRIQNFGGPEVLQYETNLPVPEPGDGEVLVKNDSIGINYVDVYWRIGMMGSTPGGILGREAEGTVIATGPGDVHGVKVGDRVVWLSMGAYAEFTAVPSATTYIIPSGVKPGIAAAALLQGLTALTLTQNVLRVKAGDWVLVHAAAGGVGLLMCQLLRNVGAKTIATASTEEKLQLAKAAGADFGINYKLEKDIVEKVKEITAGRGVDFVYDSVGKDQTENDVGVVAENGTIVSYGASSGIPPAIPPVQLALKNIRFVSPAESGLMRHVGPRPAWEKWCGVLFDLIAQGKLDIRVHDVYPLAEMERVHRDLEGRKTTGKVMVRP